MRSRKKCYGVVIILICNYSSKIISPIQSRCAIFRFSALKNEAIEEYLQKISKEENLTLSKDGINAIIDFCGGDLRKAINTLQAASAIHKNVDEKIVLHIVGQANPHEVREMISDALAGKFLEARDHCIGVARIL